MQQEVKVKQGKKEQIVTLETDKLYFGHELPFDHDKCVRKALNLPVTKQLVYYSNRRDKSSKTPVIAYKIVAMHIYMQTDRWYELELTLEDSSTVKIHSDFFEEMQDPRFIEHMKYQDEHIED